MRIITWNVNGLRAAEKNGFYPWLQASEADVIGVQEIKATPNQLSPALRAPQGYEAHFFSAEKPGYSGVAVYTKMQPLSVLHGMQAPEFDQEGRVLTLEYANVFVINAYFPNSQREHTRLEYKLRFCNRMQEYCKSLEKTKPVILMGDYNIAHREIDLKNPKSNKETAGFLPEERAWLDQFGTQGFVDAFRSLHGDLKDQYTWWSYRPGVREKNIGWRLDQFWISQKLVANLKTSEIHSEVRGSDHCPVSLQLKF